MSIHNAGEQVFSKYLFKRGMEAEKEPTWPQTRRRPDFRHDHPDAGAIVIELKDIELFPPVTSGAFDSYRLIRTHIQAALPQFAALANEEEIIPGVTVWENAMPKRKLPRDLFRGPMDQWWAVDDDKQELAYVGSKLADLRT